MLDNFNPNNRKDVERLLEYLKKDNFNSLSLDEQNKVIDLLIEISNKSAEDITVHTIGIEKGSNGVVGLDLNRIIDKMGYENFRNMMRESISRNGLQISSIGADEFHDLCKKANNGQLSEEETEKLRMVLDSEMVSLKYFAHNDQEDVQFSTYSIMHLYFEMLKSANDKDIVMLQDAEPFVNAAYITLLGSLLSNNNNPIGKMFNKHGFEKVEVDITTISAQLTELIINFGQDNDIAPERVLIALMNVIKILSAPIHTSLEKYPKDKIGEILSNLLLAVHGIDNDFEVPKNDSTNKSANADKKESNSDNDIRKLLLDD